MLTNHGYQSLQVEHLECKSNTLIELKQTNKQKKKNNERILTHWTDREIIRNGLLLFKWIEWNSELIILIKHILPFDREHLKKYFQKTTKKKHQTAEHYYLKKKSHQHTRHDVGSSIVRI